jgi:DNA polymerase IV
MFEINSIEEAVQSTIQDRWLFLDMNSFFASVEQQERPELRGKPVAVAPMDSDGTCVIAASYAAKPFGVKTGVNIGKARQMCPGLTVVAARPKMYIDYHTSMVAAVKRVLPDPKTLSVDEMTCKLWRNEHDAGDAVRLALRLKEELRLTLGEFMKSSIGIAPNVFLAKVAADLYKPNGLTIIQPNDLPAAFDTLVLRDFPGIGRKMHARLHAANIHTVRQLYAATEADLAGVWGGVVGRRWWHMLRGSTDADYGALAAPDPTSVSNSHVIEPSLRTILGAEAIMIRLLAKAASRLRLKGQLASRLHLAVSFQNDRRKSYVWKIESGRRSATGDLLSWLPILRDLWTSRPRLTFDFLPKKVCVNFTELTPIADISGFLFDEDTRRSRLTSIIDQVNTRYKPTTGRHNTVDIASVFWLNNHAPERIAFRKISDDDRERQMQNA